MDDKPEGKCRYLRGTKHTRVPKRVIALSCGYQVVPDVAGVVHSSMLLRSFATAVYTPAVPDAWKTSIWLYGGSPEPFTEVMARIQPGIENWLVSMHLGRDLTMTMFWDHVEAGDWEFDRVTDTRSVKYSNGSRGPVARRGLLVMGDTPTIVVGWWKGVKVVMVDLGNYGFNADADRSIDKYGEVKLDLTGNDELEFTDLTLSIALGETLGRFVSLTQTIVKYDMGKMRYTYGSQAMECYKHRFMSHKILLNQNKPAKEIEGKAIFGVPAIAYLKGEVKGKVYKLDVQGLYPSVMKDGLFPVKLTSHDMMTRRDYIEACDGESGIISVVNVESKSRCYPKRIDDGVVYPIGRYQTVLVGDELILASSRHDVKQVGIVLRYDLAPIFTDYVDYWWKLRQEAKAEGKVATANWAKLMLVSLWGKFAQRSVYWEFDNGVSSPVQWGLWWQQQESKAQPELFRSIAWRTQRKVDKGHSRESFPAIAAYVCMYARLRMDKLKEIAGEKSIYLQVADCLYVSETGRERLRAAGEIKEGTIGKLKEVAVSDSLTVHSAMDFSYDGTEVISGVKLGSVKVGNTSYVEMYESKLQRIITGDPKHGVHIYEILKTLKREDPPGRIGSDGWILPPVVEEW